MVIRFHKHIKILFKLRNKKPPTDFYNWDKQTENCKKPKGKKFLNFCHPRSREAKGFFYFKKIHKIKNLNLYQD